MRGLSIIILFLITLSVKSQNRTNLWELSYSDTLAYPNCEMRYVDGAMDTNLIFRSMAFFFSNSSICDTDGNLLFYSNGLTIGNRNYDTLQNAENFNPGWSTDFYEPDGLGIEQATLIIPFPGHSNLYYVFSISGELLQFDVQPLHLAYSVIDMNLDNDLGGVIDSQKNKYALVDTLANGGLMGVKHANGRDWWVIVRQYHSNGYYKVLLTPNGIEDIFYQTIGAVTTQDIIVEASFSPDGSKYCFTSGDGLFAFMVFDRCTGEFSGSISAYVPDSLPLTGCSFSPNSRFLYISSQYDLYQYDTWDSDWVNNLIHIATWDSFKTPIYNISVLFNMHQFAPDGKIYISGWNGVEYLNVITAPDSLGLACNFAPHSFILPQYNSSIPSFPNYDLGALIGSPCDTLSVPMNILTVNKPVFRISPNPTVNWLNIVYESNQDALFELFDMYGKRAAVTSLFHYFRNRLIRVSDLPAGVYLASVAQNAKIIWSEKVVIGR